jgi:hypothetical protein
MRHVEQKLTEVSPFSNPSGSLPLAGRAREGVNNASA